ncbi:rhodanese-like domain-containing protein [Granulicella tundricola]|uniref:rhodanese-like domain-containing protein n=1 Tax=Granulicella tundricola TaxID=940615 RepID=UPI0001DB7A7D|nr:rhodanese-like domain-containing protein [Granulicella tundricola]
MSLTMVVAAVLILAVLGAGEWYRRRRKRLFLASHSINVEQLHALLAGNEGGSIHVIDVRQPLDLLAHSEIIPGSRRIPPKEILGNPGLLDKEQETVVYCTCPSDETAGKIMQKAVSLGFEKVKILHGGLDAWKEKRYPVEPYESAFHLDTPA